MRWVRETPAHWDADKERVLGGLAPELFGFGTPREGDALGDEWWRVEDGDRVVGYGRLDDTWATPRSWCWSIRSGGGREWARSSSSGWSRRPRPGT